MDLNLAGKTALVTGASKGIGLAVARALAAEGCNLHLASRTQADLEAARDGINGDFGAQVTIHAADLSNGDRVRQLAKDTAGIDIPVNNAGPIPFRSLDLVDVDIAGFPLRIDEDRLRTDIFDGMCRGGVGLGRHDDLVPRTQAKLEIPQVQARRAGRYGHRLATMGEGREIFLELQRARTMNQDRAVQNLQDSAPFGIADDRTTEMDLAEIGCFRAARLRRIGRCARRVRWQSRRRGSGIRHLHSPPARGH